MASERSYQRVQIRLRRDQLDEARVLDDYDERSKMLGRPDHDYLRHLLLIGHLFVSKFSGDSIGKDVEAIALSTNESNNTGKELVKTSPSNESKTSSDVQSQEAAPEIVVGSAIRQLAGIFGGKQKGDS